MRVEKAAICSSATRVFLLLHGLKEKCGVWFVLGFAKLGRSKSKADLDCFGFKSVRDPPEETLASLKKIQIELIGIGKALADGPWHIPVYQRSYAWEANHVSELINDLDNAMNNSDDEEYFLGSIVAAGTPKSPEIVDGQQRLATISILIAAVRDYFVSVKDSGRAEVIEKEFLFDTDLRTQDQNPKLRLNSVDHEFYFNSILKRPGDKGRKVQPGKNKASQHRLKAAQGLARDYVANLTTHGKNPSSRLFDLVDFMKNGARVIWVDVPDEANAFTIFETLNDRGLDLAITDLLKNFLFDKAGNRIEEVKLKWTSMVATLEAVAEETVVVDFVRHYWSSRYGLTRDRQLYEEFKKTVTSKNLAVSFATELEEEAKIYAAMISPSHEFWDKHTETSRAYMQTLNTLGMTRLRPLILAVLSQFKKKEVETALRLLVNWSVRLLVTSSGGTGTVEMMYSDKSKAIRNGTIGSPQSLRTSIKNNIPTDAQFEEAFRIASVSKSRIARYYLQALEKQKTGKKQPEWIPNENVDEVNLEHTMPQTPSADWSQFDPDILRTYTKRIGNLSIMQTGANSSSGNEGFAAKKKRYAASDFKLTAMIAGESKWETSQIQSRQDQLAKLAVKTWPGTI